MEFALIIPEGYEVIIKRAESTLLVPHNADKHPLRNWYRCSIRCWPGTSAIVS
jgi:hypothetical protein